MTRYSAPNQPTTVVRPWSPGQPHAAGLEVLTSEPAEELVLDCARCPYSIEAHVDGRCPDEHEAVAAWGRS